MSNLRLNELLTNYTCVSIMSLRDDGRDVILTKREVFAGVDERNATTAGAVQSSPRLSTHVYACEGNTHVARMQLTRAPADVSFAAHFSQLNPAIR